MTIKYEERKYKVSLLDYLFVQWNKTMLIFKRQFRRLSILFCKQDILLYSVITLLWVIFGIGKYVVGQSFVATLDAPYTINHVLWELVEAWFSSVILSFVFSAYTRFSEYKQKIQAQHYTYVSTMNDFEAVLGRFIGDEKNKYHPLYCEKCLEDTTVFLRKASIHTPILDNNDFVIELQKITDRVEKLEEEIKTERLVFVDVPLTSDDIDQLNHLMYEVLLNRYMDTDSLIQYLRICYIIVDKLRQPWRRDEETKMVILERLNKYPENKIIDDFYYKMLLQGHPFPIKVQKTVDSESVRQLLQRLRNNNQVKPKE